MHAICMPPGPGVARQASRVRKAKISDRGAWSACNRRLVVNWRTRFKIGKDFATRFGNQVAGDVKMWCNGQLLAGLACVAVFSGLTNGWNLKVGGLRAGVHRG